MKSILILLIVFLCVGCETSKEWRYLPKSKDDEHKIYVTNHGWHTGIVIPGQLLMHKLTFLRKDFSDAEFFEVGWGDKDFYQAKEVTSGLMLKAILWPTESVMHIVAMPTDPQSYFSNSQTIEVLISSEGMEYLINFLSKSFKHDNDGNVIKSKDGFYEQSSFYEGKENYYLTNTCNSWVAQALDSAGVPIRTILTLTASSVMSQTKIAVDKYLCCH